MIRFVSKGRLSAMSLLPLMMGACLLGMTPRSAWCGHHEDRTSELTWVQPQNVDETRYVILHADQGIWTVDQVIERTGRLPEILLTRSFQKRHEAMALVRKLNSGPSSLIFAPVRAQTTETRGGRIWEATQEWSEEWERRYAEWFRSEVTADFFVQHQIATDCADALLMLRWIFSRIHALPVANTLAGSGVIFTQDSMKTEWERLPTAPEWFNDQRFRAAIGYLARMAYTHTLFRDSYPVAIRKDAFDVGVHHLRLSGETGHTMIVNHLDVSETSRSPLTLFYSDMPVKVRPLVVTSFFETRPNEARGGFLRVRWPRLTAEGWELINASDHPYYSKEQYADDFIIKDMTYALSLILRLNPQFDFSVIVNNGLSDLQTLFQYRVQVVEDGFRFCSQHDCSPGTANHEDWSTPSRDARIGTLISTVRTLVRQFSEIKSVQEAWERALSAETVSVNGERYLLCELMHAWETRSYSSEPWLDISTRWGISPTFVAMRTQALLRQHLLARERRIASQGSTCSSSSKCAPKSRSWQAYNTYESDSALLAILRSSDAYERVVPQGRRKEYRRILEQNSIEVGGLNLTTAGWFDRIVWFNSDPRSELRFRWGSRPEGYRTASYRVPQAGMAGRMAISETAVYFSDWNPHLKQIGSGEVLDPPEGFVWSHFDAATDHVVALRFSGDRRLRIYRRGIENRIEHPLPDWAVAVSAWNSGKNLPRWVLPGVLHVPKTSELSDFIDLRNGGLEVFRDIQAPARMESYGTTPGVWLTAVEGAPKEVGSFSEGSLKRTLIRGQLPAGYRVNSEGLQETALFYTGLMYRCQITNCTQNPTAFAVRKSNGQLFFPDIRASGFLMTPDSKGALIEYDDTSDVTAGIYRTSLNEELQPGALVRVGSYWEESTIDDGLQYYWLVNDEDEYDLYRYESGSWHQDRLRRDEVARNSFKSGALTVALKGGGLRLRRFGEGPTLIESDVSEFSILASSDPTVKNRFVGIQFDEENGYSALIDLKNPERVLMSLSNAGISGGDPLKIFRGVILPPLGGRAVSLEPLE